MTKTHEPQIELYESADGVVSFEVRADGETVWLTQAQLVALFESSKANISEHITRVFSEGELAEEAVVRKFRTTASDGKSYLTNHYNLDLIISVGYRVKSKVATQFRIWATSVLAQYMVQGVVVNEARLGELGRMVKILSRSVDELVAGVAEVISGYLPSLTLLRDYDAKALKMQPGSMPEWRLEYTEARAVIDAVAGEFPEDTLFGGERGGVLRGVVEGIYQGFAGRDLYPSTQQKAAHLLYFVVKDHPLTDGNKRSGAALFVTFLAKNGALYEADGTPFISNNALAALTLMIAMSEPREKDMMIALLVNMLTEVTS